MSVAIGILLAFVAMLCWGFGDFLIQKTTRKDGDWETMWAITALSTIILTPFLYKDLIQLFTQQFNTIALLLISSIVLLVAGLLDFEALKQGKLAVVEPLWSLEVIVSVLLGIFVAGEFLSQKQLILIGSLITGLFLVSLRSYHASKRSILEKGTIIAVLAALTMGIVNYLTGITARKTGALLTIWFLHLVIFIIATAYITYNGKAAQLKKHIYKQKTKLFFMSILDNSAWVAFAFAMTLAPISITVALSESYIIIAVLLGMYVNKEFLRRHQKIGLFIAIISAISLAAITI
ncbi:MAG: DMT family transporter [Nanoarchaeota archaeon]